MSRKYQTTWVVCFYHRVTPNLVLRTVGIMRLAHRAFEVFDHPALDLIRVIE
jgi:hypothetical protein